MQPTQSRFLKVAAPVSRFLVRHPKISRFLAHLPGVSRFFALPAVATVPNIRPVYNKRARRPRPRYGL